MDPVHIAKGDKNAQEKVDACLARLRQMMLDSDNQWDFEMSGDGEGRVSATLRVGHLWWDVGGNPDEVPAEATTVLATTDGDTYETVEESEEAEAVAESPAE